MDIDMRPMNEGALDTKYHIPLPQDVVTVIRGEGLLRVRHWGRIPLGTDGEGLTGRVPGT